jgi:hypothetical protein
MADLHGHEAGNGGYRQASLHATALGLNYKKFNFGRRQEVSRLVGVDWTVPDARTKDAHRSRPRDPASRNHTPRGRNLRGTLLDLRPWMRERRAGGGMR